jgi:hypothetical protein
VNPVAHHTHARRAPSEATPLSSKICAPTRGDFANLFSSFGGCSLSTDKGSNSVRVRCKKKQGPSKGFFARLVVNLQIPKRLLLRIIRLGTATVARIRLRIANTFTPAQPGSPANAAKSLSSRRRPSSAHRSLEQFERALRECSGSGRMSSPPTASRSKAISRTSPSRRLE